MWRLKQLGFNAVRLPFSFKHFHVSHHRSDLLTTASRNGNARPMHTRSHKQLLVIIVIG